MHAVQGPAARGLRGEWRCMRPATSAAMTLCTTRIMRKPSATPSSSCKTSRRSSVIGTDRLVSLPVLCLDCALQFSAAAEARWRLSAAVRSTFSLPFGKHSDVSLGACCRERRKQRFQELEGALNVLADQMNDKQTEVSDLWVGHGFSDDQEHSVGVFGADTYSACL